VQPVELARKLAKEMDAHKTASVQRVYVPNEYTVYLGKQDRAKLEGYERSLEQELSGYLLEHARRRGYDLLTRPAVGFDTDERLRLGEFGIQARLVRPDEDPRAAPSQGEEGHTMVYSTSDRISEPLREPDPRRGAARLRIGGRSELLGSGGATLGRSRDADIVLDDANVSRKHAEVRPSGGSWIVRDLGSTNGVKVNGRRIQGPQSLKRGDVIELGTSRATFELE
jgi:hypothetical protein